MHWLQAIELAKGRTPFEGQKPLKVLKSILRCDPPQLTGDFSMEFKVLSCRSACLRSGHRNLFSILSILFCAGFRQEMLGSGSSGTADSRRSTQARISEK